jgi:hypothetical protein
MYKNLDSFNKYNKINIIIRSKIFKLCKQLLKMSDMRYCHDGLLISESLHYAHLISVVYLLARDAKIKQPCLKLLWHQYMGRTNKYPLKRRM